MSDVAIDVSGLTKSFGTKRVVNDFSITVPRGAIYGFLGPNGSGKTTTIRMLCGLLTADAGSGTCLGFDVMREQLRIKERVGYMTQKFSLYGDLTIRENVRFFARLHGRTPLEAVVDEVLETFDLTSRADQQAGQLSGGWKQRLALATATLNKLIDAPSAGLAREVGIHTVRIKGEGLSAVYDALEGVPGVEQRARFGSAIHVSGKDEAALLRAAQQTCDDYGVSWETIDTGLEDAFIYLMAGSQDNFASRPQ